MIELSRHIESLMLKHDCVIVPGLGGFVTQYVPARRIEDELLFLPPYRSVGFNQQLTLNDGLLVQSYMQAYDTNYPETVKLIEDAVRQLKDELQKNGEYELSGIGTLSMQIGGQYNFAPCEAGVLSPELYGLDALTINKLSADESGNPKKGSEGVSEKKVKVKRTEKNYTISVSRELVNYAASIAVAVLFYFLWAPSVTDSTQVDSQAASVVYEQLFSHTKTVGTDAANVPVGNSVKSSAQALKAHPEVDKVVSNRTSEEVQTAAAANEANHKDIGTSTAVSAAEMRGKYTLVLASSIPKRSAEEYAASLRSSGYSHADTYVSGRMVRVVYGLYPTETEALNTLKTLRKNKQFREAWLMKIK